MDLNNKKIVITGAASGIGKALLEQLMSLPGTQIVASDLNEFDHPERDGLYIHRGDISHQEGVDDLFDFAIEQLGGIDLFVANAGFAYYEKPDQANWQHISRIYQCNTFSPIYSAQKMATLNQGQEYGVLITASFMGLYSLAGYSLYSSTKAALLSWAKAYKIEKNDLGHVMMLCPVATKTAFFNTKAPVPWPTQTAEQVAHYALKGVAKNRHRIYPSKLSVLTLLLNWVCPLVMPIYQRIEAFKFRRWLTSQQADPSLTQSSMPTK